MSRSYLRRGSRRSLIAAAVVVLSTSVAGAQQPPSPPLARLQFDIIGVRLVVDPPALTVPKNIATQINTSLVTPTGLGADVTEAIAALTAGAQVEAELRGPSLTPTRIAVVPGQPLPIPPLAVPGDYFLDGIRLTKDGQTILDATSADSQPATTIPIRVINEVLVASVTSTTAVARRHPQQRHRHRREQLQCRQFPGRLQHRRHAVHDQRAGSPADGRSCSRRRAIARNSYNRSRL